MTALDRLRQIASALPSDSSVTFTRASLVALLAEDDAGDLTATLVRDLTVAEVAEQLGRAPSTVRDWLLSKDLHGYKFNREWRVTESALRDYLNRPSETDKEPAEVDIGAWRNVRRG